MNEITLEVHEDEKIELTVENLHEVSTDDYEKLKNLPTLNGVPMLGEMQETDPTVPEWAKEPGKPEYTPEEIGAIGEKEAMTLGEIEEIFNSIFNIGG